MQDRRYRPGDVLDDYCPRERRITDHAIVAMIDDEIRRTRCGVCDAEHEYKEAKVPTPRRKTQPPALFTQVLDRHERAGRRSRIPPTPPAPTPVAATEPRIDAVAAAAAAEPRRQPPPSTPQPPVEPQNASEPRTRPPKTIASAKAVSAAR